MNLNYVLTWFAGLSGALLLYRAAQARRLGWAVVAAAVVGVTLAAALVLPGGGGYVGGAALALLVFLPLFGYRRVFRAMLQQQFGRARRLASLVRWLHPADGWWALPAFLEVLEAREPEAMARAAALLERRGAGRTGVARLGATLLFRMNNQWRELLEWIRANVSPEELRRDPNLATLYLRAHGELGDPNGVVDGFRHLGEASKGRDPLLYRNMWRLMACAFGGRKEQVARLFAGPLEIYPEPVRRFWLATADMALGNADAARQELQDVLAYCEEPLTRAGIEWRLSHPLPLADEVLTGEAREVLSGIDRSLDQEERYGVRPAVVRRRAWWTYAIVAVNLAVFALEMLLGGSTDEPTLRRMGALVPAAVAQGAWWRLLAATFLHFGWLHLAMNMLALVLLGPFIEFAMGAARYLVAYLVTGVGSMACVALLALAGGQGAYVVVGASGAIMGLVGATGAVLVRGWARERSMAAWRRLSFVAFIVVLQVVFDLATPEVSFSGHLAGVLIGFIAASLMRHRISRAAAAVPEGAASPSGP